MKIAVLSDTHAGFKNSSPLFQDMLVKFFDESFFPVLEDRQIRHIIHCGDVFDSRRMLNVQSINNTRVNVLERLNQYKTSVILGNHDCYHRDGNEVNSVRELCGHYENFRIYEEPEEVEFEGRRVLFVPWLNATNMPAALEMITRTKAKLLMGHLEISGFKLDQTQVCDHGLDRSVFNKFESVLSGHFHHASQDGPIRYLGSVTEMTFADLNDPKGFYILDTETLELEFIQNPNRMFYRLVYDDRDKSKQAEMLATNFSEFANKFVRLIVPYKTNPILYEQYVDSLNNSNPADFQIREQFSLEVSEEADEQFADFEQTGEVVLTDTITILNNYVDSMGMDIDRSRLKDVLRELYTEAVTISGRVG